MSLRRALDEALDPGPEFPSPALPYRISAALDDPPDPRPRRTRRIAAGAAVLVLAGLVVGTLLISRTARPQPAAPLVVSGSNSLSITTARPVPAASSAAGLLVTSQFLSPEVGWAAQFGPSGVTHVSRTLDGGNTWTEVEEVHGLGPWPRAQFFSSGEAILVGQPVGPGRFGIRAYATSDGTQWTQNEAPMSVGFLRKAYFVNSHEGWLITGKSMNSATNEATTLWHTADAGAHWERVTDSSTVQKLGDPRAQLAFDSARRGWLYGTDALLRSTDGGRSWQNSFIQAAAGSIDLIGRPQGDLVQVTSNKSGQVYRTADGGRTWTHYRPLAHLGTASFLSDDRWVVPAFGRFDITQDGGRTFATASVGVPAGWRLFGSQLVSGEVVTAPLTDLGGSVEVGPGGPVKQVPLMVGGSAAPGSTEPIDMKIQGTPPRFAFVRSLDGGRTWSAVAVPDLP